MAERLREEVRTINPVAAASAASLQQERLTEEQQRVKEAKRVRELERAREWQRRGHDRGWITDYRL